MAIPLRKETLLPSRDCHAARAMTGGRNWVRMRAPLRLTNRSTNGTANAEAAVHVRSNNRKTKCKHEAPALASQDLFPTPLPSHIARQAILQQRFALLIFPLCPLPLGEGPDHLCVCLLIGVHASLLCCINGVVEVVSASAIASR